MRLRHMVLIRFVEAVTDEQVEALSQGLGDLPAKIDQIRSYEHGRDAGVRQATWDYGVVAEFDSAEDFVTYLEHPGHRALVDGALNPISAERASVQFWFD